ncbi:MAG: hypothetical protein ACKPKO_18905, partial [Candidatus Fonsibacter sp.]
KGLVAEKSKDNHTSGYYKMQTDETTCLTGRIRGGGKRGRGGATGASKDTMIKVLKETIGTSMIRINAMPGASPVVTELMKRFNQISQGVVLNPTQIFSEVLTILNVPDMLNMVEAITGSNNLKARFNAIVNVVFKDIH